MIKCRRRGVFVVQSFIFGRNSFSRRVKEKKIVVFLKRIVFYTGSFFTRRRKKNYTSVQKTKKKKKNYSYSVFTRFFGISFVSQFIICNNY